MDEDPWSMSVAVVNGEILLTKYGPAYTEEAWKIHYGNRKLRK